MGGGVGGLRVSHSESHRDLGPHAPGGRAPHVLRPHTHTRRLYSGIYRYTYCSAHSYKLQQRMPTHPPTPLSSLPCSGPPSGAWPEPPLMCAWGARLLLGAFFEKILVALALPLHAAMAPARPPCQRLPGGSELSCVARGALRGGLAALWRCNRLAAQPTRGVTDSRRNRSIGWKSGLAPEFGRSQRPAPPARWGLTREARGMANLPPRPTNPTT